MPESKSTTLYERGREAQQKFDYFIAAITGGIFTYVAQTYQPRVLDLSASTLEPLALMFLAVSFFIGLKRIEATFIATRHNFETLAASEKAGRMTEAINEGGTHGFDPGSGEIYSLSDLHEQRERSMLQAKGSLEAFEKVSTRATHYYNFRNYFLYAGFCSLFFAKILTPYFDTTKLQKPQPQTPSIAPTSATNPPSQK